MSKFVGVLVNEKKHLGEVHVAGCSDLAGGEYFTQEHETPEGAHYECEGLGGTFQNDEFVTDFPTIFAPCVKTAKGGAR
jgi:hypothetical protein